MRCYFSAESATSRRQVSAVLFKPNLPGINQRAALSIRCHAKRTHLRLVIVVLKEHSLFRVPYRNAAAAAGAVRPVHCRLHRVVNKRDRCKYLSAILSRHTGRFDAAAVIGADLCFFFSGYKAASRHVYILRVLQRLSQLHWPFADTLPSSHIRSSVLCWLPYYYV